MITIHIVLAYVYTLICFINKLSWKVRDVFSESNPIPAAWNILFIFEQK